MPQHIGIVACSAEGAALCYRTIAEEGALVMGRHAHPEVSMHTHPLSEYMEFIYQDDWQGVAGLMLSSAKKLAAIGADFLICPDNTIHQALPEVLPRSPLPWLHIAEVVAGEARAHGYRKLAVLGTRYLMNSAVYPGKLEAAGITRLIPRPDEQEEINRVIFDDLVHGRFQPAARKYFVGVIQRMQSEGCDAVVLGCTEIPLLISQHDSPLPTLDSTRLLARAAVQKAIGSAVATAG